ncbi:MAG: hypothetical protein H6884_01215 [Rhodobiaceae bacterium]|nr:hypothetical protein [Rhodobiaceae bacterium]MCC0052659.1 hypothetical protein [Rhodobiaceae bacterium]
MKTGGIDFWTVATPVTGLLVGFVVAGETDNFWAPIIAAFLGAGAVRGVQYLAEKREN